MTKGEGRKRGKHPKLRVQSVVSIVFAASTGAGERPIGRPPKSLA
jgi:hypothetical protein